MARKLRVGFVGLGRVFDLNVRGYLDHPDAEVSALCDANPTILARRAAEHPGAHATCEFQNFLRCDLDLIEILTPHPLHEAMTVAALAGGSHVSVQKPMAMTLPECDRMIEAAAASGRRLKVFENFVFYPPLVRARELLRDGAIGRPLHFRMKVVMADRAQAWRVPDAASRWRAPGCAVASLRQSVRERAVPAVDGRQWRRLLDEPFRKRVGQRRHGKLLLLHENRTDRPKDLPYPGRRQGRRVRLHREILQHDPQALDHRLPQPG
jgi:hypothetical protein